MPEVSGIQKNNCKLFNDIAIWLQQITDKTVQLFPAVSKSWIIIISDENFL